MSKYAGLDRNDTFEPAPSYCFQNARGNNWGQAWGIHPPFGLAFDRRVRVDMATLLEEARADDRQMARELGQASWSWDTPNRSEDLHCSFSRVVDSDYGRQSHSVYPFALGAPAPEKMMDSLPSPPSTKPSMFSYLQGDQLEHALDAVRYTSLAACFAECNLEASKVVTVKPGVQ